MKIYQQNEVKENNPIFQTEKHGKLSSKYGFISSKKILDYFENQGFTLDGISYAKVRHAENQGYQKHIMVFSRPDLVIDDGNKIQILALNSHDGKNALRLNIGIYRAVCSNGIVAGSDIFESRVKHLGNFKENLKESLNYIMQNLNTLKTDVIKMQKTQIDLKQKTDFIRKIVELRFKDISNVSSIDFASVDAVRRADDNYNDLYTVFNRIQESIIKGGIKYNTLRPELNKETGLVLLNDDGTPKLREFKNTTRKISDFKKSIELNKILFNEALKLIA